MIHFPSFTSFLVDGRNKLPAVLMIPALLLAACAPFQSPGFLQNTPGAQVILYDHGYTGETFSVSYPPGWRVITPPAEAPESVVLAGEDCQIVHISTIRIEPSAPPECHADQMRFETLEQHGVYIYGGAPAGQWDSFEPLLSQIAASLTTNND